MALRLASVGDGLADQLLGEAGSVWGLAARATAESRGRADQKNLGAGVVNHPDGLLERSFDAPPVRLDEQAHRSIGVSEEDAPPALDEGADGELRRITPGRLTATGKDDADFGAPDRRDLDRQPC
jgi:hypothetical protein